MGEFEDTLQSILSSPKEMEKILGLAREITGSVGEASDSQSPEPPPKTATEAPGLGDLNPKLLGILGKLMGEFSSKKDDKSALISSMKPYVRPERRATLDRAVKIARIARIARAALDEFGGELDLGL